MGNHAPERPRTQRHARLFCALGATCKGATDHDRLGWEPLRTDVYKGIAELPGPGPGPVASAPHTTPSFQRVQLGPTTQGPSQLRGAPGLGQWGALACHGGSRANGIAHRATHIHTDRSCEPAHVGLLLSPPWSRGSTFSLQFSSRHGPWAARINPASPWLAPVSPSSGVPNPARAKGHGSGEWGSCRARSCSAPRPAGIGTL